MPQKLILIIGLTYLFYLTSSCQLAQDFIEDVEEITLDDGLAQRVPLLSLRMIMAFYD